MLATIWSLIVDSLPLFFGAYHIVSHRLIPVLCSAHLPACSVIRMDACNFFPYKADSDGELKAKVLICARIHWPPVDISSTWFHTGKGWVEEEDAVSRS